MSKNYSIILADPPWTFNTYSDRGKGRSADRHYNPMTTADICALPVAALAADNCALFLWIVPQSLPEALEVIRAWGFTYRTKAWTWVKLQQNWTTRYLPMAPVLSSQTSILYSLLRMSLGYYTRKATEDCLLAVKGRMPVDVRNELDVIFAAITGEHSEKPAEQYAKIERLYPAELYPARLELFARQSATGWDVWGNQVESDVKLNGYRPHSRLDWAEIANERS